MIARALSPGTVSGYPLVEEPYNDSPEKDRKSPLSMVLHKHVLAEAKKISESRMAVWVNLKPKVPTKAICAEHLELRKEILRLLNLQKQIKLQYKEAEGSSYRDGSYIGMLGTPKCSQRVGDQDRSFVPDSASFGGERVGNKDQKHKGSGRLSEAPSSAAHKRPRKLKASDL